LKIQIGLFFGGKSVEHEVSIITAIQAANNLNKDKYEVTYIYISRDGNLYTGEMLSDITNFRNISELISKSTRVIPVSNANGTVSLFAYPFKWHAKPIAEIEVALPAVHGTNVEDGTLQGYLRTLGLPIVGCDVTASALGMDKYAQKTLYRDAGLPVLDAIKFSANEFRNNTKLTIERIEASISYPVVIKPLNLGSSVGVKLAGTRAELTDAIELAAEFSAVILAEKAIPNLREINCAVLGDRDSAKASECEEPIGSDEILSYEDKYIAGPKNSASKGMATLKRLLPAPITPEQKEKVKNYAIKAFLALGCSGVARIDFLMDKETEELYVNEINTIPGSLAFYLWEASGVKYSELLDELIALAYKRQREDAESNYTIETGILQSYTDGSKTAKS